MSTGLRDDRKGQALAPDFVASISIFLIVLVGSAIIWNTTVTKYSQLGQNQFMQERAYSITDTLIRTEGYPPGWNSTNVRMIGLSEGTSHVLNESLLAEFNKTDAEAVKRIWGIGGYNYHINITNASREVIVLPDGTRLEYGTAPFGQKDLVPLKRLVLINESGTLVRATLVFMIWR